MNDDDDLELIRVYAWGGCWIEVYYGQHGWPSRCERSWLFEPWPPHMR